MNLVICVQEEWAVIPILIECVTNSDTVEKGHQVNCCQILWHRDVVFLEDKKGFETKFV